MKFNDILQKHRKLAISERDKGSRFERIIQLYLLTDPKYAPQFEKMWLWNEFPYRTDFGGQDTGTDLVAKTTEGDYWAIQCKCYQEEARIDKAEVDTFLSTSSRSFKDDLGEIIHFTQRLWISTTNNWSSNATEALVNQHPPVTRLNLYELQEAPVDWGKIDRGIFGEVARISKKELMHHQKEALLKTLSHFEKADRGKLIMACGTGKTFTSLRIAEKLTENKGTVLFLVPSIALLGQTLREWTADAKEDINPICICSDAEISREKKKNEDTDTYSVIDLALPASTNVETIIKQFEDFDSKNGLTVVFSTYQSIEVIANTQKRLESIGSRFSKFELIICDEAHRTTGVTLENDDESSFVKVHDNNFIKADKRLYMTATPRLYGEESKSKATQVNAVLCSMDDKNLYGEEMYRIGFGEAVENDLLSDYKVLILTLSEDDITPEVQRILKNENNEISTDDMSKLIGCINAMSKQILGDKGVLDANDPEPMRRAVAFCQSIKISKKITHIFNAASDVYKESVPELKQRTMVNLKSDHIDGTMSATDRDKLMSWLKSEPQDPLEARVLTNVRCLSEGVDVPSLDAVMFLSAKNSQIDVVQSVGRVMRKSPGKQYGYIIIPVVVPSNVPPEKALNDNERYKVVWTVLNALRAHDDRFNATVNKIELNKNRPSQILVGRIDPDGDGDITNDLERSKKELKEVTQQTKMHFENLQSVIYAKLVQKVGDRLYWENFTKSIADVAKNQIMRIHSLIGQGEEHEDAFDNFVEGLRKNINPSISDQQAIEMLAQHIITKPIFEALFEGYSFVQHNAVSKSMQHMMDLIDVKGLSDEDQKKLDEFYKFVQRRAANIDNAEGKQKIIVEIYDKFFKVAFPKMVEQLGIVYTPIEVVDFIIHSVNDVLQKEFGKRLSDQGINILDPFTGTGTFITRLIQSGLIDKKDLERKYKNELFANELVLLAYYIAAVNIENAYHDVMGEKNYESFDGITLTDTFQLNENNDDQLFSETLAENSERVIRQKNTPLQVIIGNPPYSVGQKSANDNAQNQKYPKLDTRIASTYAAETKATNKNSLYDSYIKAFRWASDRLSNEGGIIAYVSNGSWIDGNAQDGMRKTLEKEFTNIYVFNLRGNQRTSGELSRREGGKIFGSGSRTPIAITLLIKNPTEKKEKANIFYLDIGDYLSREQKLKIIKNFRSVTNSEMEWKNITPNNHDDWINQRNTLFENFITLAGEKNSFFNDNSSGSQTARDAWIYNFSSSHLQNNLLSTIKFYNAEIARIAKYSESEREKLLKGELKEISWTRGLKRLAVKGKKLSLYKEKISKALYRPYIKEFQYFDSNLIEYSFRIPKYFPNQESKNLVICLNGRGSSINFSSLIMDVRPDYEVISKSQCFPLYYYEKVENAQKNLFSTETEYVRHDGISDFILKRAQNQYGSSVTKEDIFYYVYGILHSPEYRKTFANDLKKMLPRLPLMENTQDFWAFSKAGRELAELHVNYEKISAYEGVKVTGTQHNNYHVTKMKFAGKDKKDTIFYNDFIKIENIPAKAYEYVVNGRSAIEWIMERYQVKTDKDSGIVNDPNDWCKEVNNPRYILDLLLSIIKVSMQTVDIVKSLPKLTFETEGKN